MSRQCGMAWMDVLAGLVVSSVFLLLLYGLMLAVGHFAGVRWAWLVPDLPPPSKPHPNSHPRFPREPAEGAGA